MSTNTRHSSFLKWAGGKYNALPQILPFFPDCSEARFVEPFFGSGTVGLNINAKSYWINDLNTDLIAAHKWAIVNPSRISEWGRRFFTKRHNTDTEYYKIRERFNASKDTSMRGRLFYYLNRHAFNGICRYNASGGFNVPFGKYAAPAFPKNEVVAFSNHFKNRVKITNLDFTKVLDQVVPTDIIYLDPPYVPLSLTASFSDYTANGFSLDQQKMLADYAQKLVSQGNTILISNHDTVLTRELYKSATTIHSFPVSRTISAKTANRVPVLELLAIWRP